MTAGSEWSDQPVVTPLVIVESGAPSSGLFVYSGTPGPGNPPVASIVAPGVTTDPYGNTVTPIIMTQNGTTPGSLRSILNGGILSFVLIGGSATTSPAVQNFGGNGGGLLLSSGTVGGLIGHLLVNPGAVFSDGISAWDPAAGYPTGETWHTATLGTGWTGSVRYKRAADVSRVFLEVNATFTDNGTTHLASGTDILGVALPAGYQPANASPEMAAGITGTGFTIAASRVPGVHVGTGGAVFADFVTTNTNGQTATFSGEFSYPLD